MEIEQRLIVLKEQEKQLRGRIESLKLKKSQLQERIRKFSGEYQKFN
jgi:predicted nuclease with TOPRIM domain